MAKAALAVVAPEIGPGGFGSSHQVVLERNDPAVERHRRVEGRAYLWGRLVAHPAALVSVGAATETAVDRRRVLPTRSVGPDLHPVGEEDAAEDHCERQ